VVQKPSHVACGMPGGRIPVASDAPQFALLSGLLDLQVWVGFLRVSGGEEAVPGACDASSASNYKVRKAGRA
jgi:hypothetical protein